MIAQTASEHILIVGGTSGIGLALVERLLAAGHEVTVVGRSASKLASVREELVAEKFSAVAADVTREDDVERLFSDIAPPNHIVSTAADISGAYVMLEQMEMVIARRVFDSKVLGPLLLAKHGARRLVAGGSITFTSGIAAHRPAAKGSVVAAVNGALESLVKALAIELAPVRVNAVSPGWVDTPIWEQVAGEGKHAMLEAMAQKLPLRKNGQPTDIAGALEFAMHNPFMTGTVLHVDGGQRLV